MKKQLVTLSLLAITAPAAAVEERYLATAAGFPLEFEAEQLTGVSQSLEVVAWPSLGSLEVQTGGVKFVYSPDPGSFGVDSLQLRTSDFGQDLYLVRISVAPERIPVALDWNCDGVTELGSYDSGDQRLYLYDDYGVNDPAPTWYEFRYDDSEPGWLPFGGNFDSDANGCDEPGLYDPATGSFHLLLLPPEPPLPEGAEIGWLTPYEKLVNGPLGAGELPLAGAWDGAGADRLGLFFPGDPGLFLLWTKDPPGGGNVVAFGPAGSRPVTGDWDGDEDGVETIGVFSELDLEFLLRDENSTGAPDLVLEVPAVAAGQLPVAGVWEEEGSVSLGLFDADQGVIRLYRREEFLLAAYVEVVLAKPGGGMDPPR